ncbi:MAG: TAXI family TRAP transporter solute-binding subunit [Burkholderiales bacterium]|jgi:TRAP-type uncharacterized transport system substrate-binding protein
MNRTLRRLFVSLRAALVAGGPFVLITVGLLVLAYRVLEPNPPRHAVMVTGHAQSAFDAFGEQYRRALAGQGIMLELRQTGGAVANLAALNDPDGDVAFGFVQGGLASGDEAAREGLSTLGSLFYEPVWIFHKRTLPKGRPVRLVDLDGWRVNVGTAESGTPELFTRLLEANRIDPSRLKRSELGDTEAVIELIEDRIDAVVFVSAPESLLVQMLLQTPGVGLLDFPQAEAYARRYPFLSPVTLPRGIVSIDRDIPLRNHPLVATTTSLVVREGTHPALVQLMVQAADRIHGGPGWFRRSGEFPTPRGAELPVATEAARFYADGEPFLQRYMPWWVANLLDRMWLALAAIVAVLLPLSRIVPPLYEFRVRSRVFRWYAQLRAIEDELVGPLEPDAKAALRTRLDALDARVEKVAVPLSYADELYALRSNIGMVRGRLV